MLLSKVIKLYAESRTADGFAANTVRNNENELTRFTKMIGDMDTSRIGPKHVDMAFRQMTERGMAPSTMNQYHGTLAGFFRWCRERGYMRIDQNPIGTRRYRPNPPKQRDIVPASQFGALLDAAGRSGIGARDRAFVAAALYTMCRQSELIGVRIKDVNLEYGEMEIAIPKTYDRDILPIVSELDSELRRWLSVYQQQMGGKLDPDWLLFPSYTPTGFHEYSPVPHRRIAKSEAIVRRALEGIGWRGDWIGTHVLRRSAATARLEENIEMGHDGAMRDVQAWLHHKSITTTERYVSRSLDRDRRDQRAKGKPMFPSLSEEKADTVRLVESNGDDLGEAHDTVLRQVR